MQIKVCVNNGKRGSRGYEIKFDFGKNKFYQMLLGQSNEDLCKV